MPIRMLVTSLAVLPMTMVSGSALAHWGHLGELAGHGHWAGLGALVVAGTIAAIAAKARKGADEREPEEGAEDTGEPSGEVA